MTWRSEEAMSEARFSLKYKSVLPTVSVESHLFSRRIAEHCNELCRHRHGKRRRERICITAHSLGPMDVNYMHEDARR